MEVEEGKNHKHEESRATPLYFVRPFQEANTNAVSWLKSFSKEFRWLLKQRAAIKILFYILINLTGTILLLLWCRKSSSLALLAYTYLSWFNFLSLLTCLLSIWIEAYVANFTFTFGLVSCEILAVFSSVILTMLGNLFVLKESLERLIEPDYPQLNGISGISFLALVMNLIIRKVTQNPALTHIIKSSSMSMLQEHIMDMGLSFCVMFPSLKKILRPKLDPLVLISIIGFIFIVGDQIVVQIYRYPRGDAVAAILISLLTIISMYPLCICSANLLLQTIPASHLAHLDKCLREALTVDGVLEFRNENFWVLGVGYRNKNHRFSSGMMNGSIVSGTLHVRVRRDANEQLVLNEIKSRLQPLVPLLTVQVFKDDWTRSSTTLQLLNESSLGSPKFNLSFNSLNSTSYLQEKTTIPSSSPLINPLVSFSHQNGCKGHSHDILNSNR